MVLELQRSILAKTNHCFYFFKCTSPTFKCIPLVFHVATQTRSGFSLRGEPGSGYRPLLSGQRRDASFIFITQCVRCEWSAWTCHAICLPFQTPYVYNFISVSGLSCPVPPDLDVLLYFVFHIFILDLYYKVHPCLVAGMAPSRATQF